MNDRPLLLSDVAIGRESGYSGAKPKWALARHLRRNPKAMIGACVLLVVAMAALTAPWIAPYDPAEPDFADTMSPPTFQHLLGTDDLGRDQLSRILFGARVALTAGLLPVGLACVVGVSLGLIAGYAGGKIDKAIVAFLDAVLAFPDLVLIIAITAALGPNLRNALIAIAFTSFPGFARVVRAQVMSLNEQDFVIAARAVGARDYKIVGRHILPNVVAPVIVIASLAVGGAILAEAALSYLGLGVQPPQASWGQMVNTGSSFLRIAPWMAIVPGMAIFITVLATNFLGDGLRDALDPRLRNSG